MNTKQKGDCYEDFVANVYKAMAFSGNSKLLENLTIEKNKIIKDISGVKRQIDVYWEYKLLGQTYTTAVECKNYNSTITVEKIDAFVTKINSLGISKGIIATKKGFQSGAISVAKRSNISLIVIREPEDADFEGRIRKIELSIHCLLAPRIIIETFKPSLDWDWMKENIPDFDGKIPVKALETEIIITNFDNGIDYSIHEIQNSILPRDVPGRHHWEKEFENSFWRIGDRQYKITKLTFQYEAFQELIDISTLDFSDYLYAVIDYIGEERKEVLSKHGQILPF